MTNLHLFELINAPPGLGHFRLAVAIGLAQWAIYLLPLAGVFAWLRGPRVARVELLMVTAAVFLALALAQIVAHVWPQARPFALHMGAQYLAHSADPGMPSDHAVVIWTVAMAVLRTERFAVWGLPLFSLGLAVGWCRVYLGVHFPLDIVAALPVAGAATLLMVALKAPLFPALSWLAGLHDKLMQRLQRKSELVHDARVDES